MIEEIFSHPESLGKERLLKLHQAFESYDKAGNGYLGKNDTKELFKKHWIETGIDRKPTD